MAGWIQEGKHFLAGRGP